MYTKADFVDWKNSPVTQDFLKCVKMEVEMNKDMLAEEAGRNPIADSQVVGYITGMRFLMQWTPAVQEENSV